MARIGIKATVNRELRRCEKIGFPRLEIFASRYTRGRDAPLGRLHLPVAGRFDFFTRSQELRKEMGDEGCVRRET
jgi:hypothetical protein